MNNRLVYWDVLMMRAMAVMTAANYLDDIIRNSLFLSITNGALALIFISFWNAQPTQTKVWRVLRILASLAYLSMCLYSACRGYMDGVTGVHKGEGLL